MLGGKKSSLGIDENIANLLAYLLGWVTGLVFLFLEKQNDNVRYNAAQSVVVFGGLTLASLVVSVIPGIGPLLQGVIGLAAFGLWIVLMVTSVLDKPPRLPVVDGPSEKLDRAVRDLQS